MTRNSLPTEIDAPPFYHTTSSSCENNLPLYTECPGHSELRVLHSGPATAGDAPAAARTRQCIYQTDYLKIDVGEFPHAVMRPSYGFNGVVEGVITFRKKCTFVTHITVELEGSISTSSMDHAKLPGFSKLPLFNRSTTLFSVSNPQDTRCIAADTLYRFSIPFPTYIDGQSAQLPPSHIAIHPGVSSDVSYSLHINVVRKGLFRRNEACPIPVYYLPKTRPSMATLLELPPLSLDAVSNRVKAISLMPTWPSTCQARSLTSQGTELPSVQAFLPLPRCYPSGEPIPMALKISCLSSPALTRLYFPNIEVQLVKRRKIYVGLQRQYSLRENVLNTAVIDHKTCLEIGGCCVIMRLEAGAMGRECSWSVDGVIDIQYVIRISVRPPKGTPHLPIFRHDEMVQLTTDPYESLETEMLTGNISAPAFGLTTLRPGPDSIYQTRA
ncbi:uncharacterized protein PHACADRAFT_121358 [Phanerochaete carnosa HHB-10118-sp]|uniref:Arrestin-like N-terminal domain-containing protein n=1 Tax=Phanerochaete carnosa (strain HHB-10118-sp) TaxID=650164 RepID=K5UZM9_PHACS|nr:uncharacterized protein PHACADRAFT_121358 [Phanerochaete carnosa HHB-10118-sp]EKM55636.1 hypothetical protein PHACADRAFT_121358 [Phanerochaete carnosa HHB-10118-sp]